jgi:anti-anti-sigma regulatory factor
VIDSSMTRERQGERVIFRLGGVFDRTNALALRDSVERETVTEVVLDFTRVRDFSDLGVAVLAHGITSSGRRVLFRGLRQHQLRIFRYCGVAVEELTSREAAMTPIPSADAQQL